jgi:peptide/nickel transport system substrate-binding protein
MLSPMWNGFDPQTTSNPIELEVLRCCLVRTLMAFPGLPGFAGTQPVPDLSDGPPTVSADGRTWTFHLRHGIHYAPPLQNVEVTAPDFVRALMRTAKGTVTASGDPSGMGAVYLPRIEGYQEFLAGAADSISGVTSPDPYTLQVREVRPDRSILSVFAEPFSAPIPPSPTDPAAPLGVATGHGVDLAPPTSIGYGPYLAATGPYMFEGADQIDYSAAPSQQVPPSGLQLAWSGDQVGGVTLVRNPSWRAGTDPNRPALPDRIVLSFSGSTHSAAMASYAALASGAFATVMGDNPPPRVISRYDRLGLQSRAFRVSLNATRFALFNLALPPFDDIHVRRALAILLDRQAVSRSMAAWPHSQTSPITHFVPYPLENSYLTSWDALGGAASSGRLALARAQMRMSRYGDPKGRCSGPACGPFPIMWPDGSGTVPVSRRRAQARPLVATLAKLGLTGRVTKAQCFDPAQRVPLCATGWIPDYPAADAMLVLFHYPESAPASMMGTPPGELAKLGYRRQRLPSINASFARCQAAAGPTGALCWARLDQVVVSQYVAVIPLDTPDVIRLAGPNVTAFSMDQAFTEPALDRLAVRTSSP